MHPAAAADGRQTWEDRLAGPMFFLAVLFLVVLAGLIHRYRHLGATDPEAYLIRGVLAGLWVVFLVEAVVRFALRDRTRPAWKALGGVAVVALVPPLRMACRSQVRPNHIWLPGLGYQEITGRLRRTLERAFSIPMIFVALMVLPLLVLEYFEAAKHPVLILWLDVGTSVVWLAFAVELIVMLAVSDRPWRYCFLHWIDVAIVFLPAVELLPLFRLLRLGRVLRLEQLLRWGRLARLQAVLAHCWRAFLLLQIVQRLTGRSLEHRRKQLQDLLHAKEEEVADLRREIQELEVLIAQKAIHRKALVSARHEAQAECELGWTSHGPMLAVGDGPIPEGPRAE
jgi:voltage-gated potassium channel